MVERCSFSHLIAGVGQARPHSPAEDKFLSTPLGNEKLPMLLECYGGEVNPNSEKLLLRVDPPLDTDTASRAAASAIDAYLPSRG